VAFDDDLPDGALAYREYEVTTPSGESGSLALTLGDADADFMPARFAKHAGARAFGLVSILGFSDAPRYPVIWLQMESQIGVTVADGDDDLSPELRQIIARYLAVFFNDIAPVAPELAALELQSDGRGGRSLN
jgi:hypothetical protein